MLRSLLQNGLCSSTRVLALLALALWAGAAAADERELDEVLPPRTPLPAAGPAARAGSPAAASRPAPVAAAARRAAEPKRPLGFGDRFGPALGLGVAPLADVRAGAVDSRAWGQVAEPAPAMPSTTARLGARFALLERSEAPLSATPTVSLLVRLDDAGRAASMGLGVEARLGAALVKPVAGLFPLAELYALAAVGGAGLGLRADEPWVRLGVGLQLNLYTLLGSGEGLAAFARGFFSGLQGYYQGFGGLFGGGWGGGLGGGSGGGAVLVVVLGVIVAALVLPPLVLGAAFLATLAGMAANVELSWRVATPGLAPVPELRVGIGF